MREVLIKLDGNELIIKGEYYPEEVENGLPQVFEVESIESVNKDIYDLLEFVSCRSMTYMQTIEDLCLESINS